MVLINAKIQTYLSNPNWLLFIYNLGGLHLNMNLNLTNAHNIHFDLANIFGENITYIKILKQQD